MITLFGFEPITFFILTIHRQPRLLSIQNISCFAENVITLNTFYLHARVVGVEDYAHLNWVHVDKRRRIRTKMDITGGPRLHFEKKQKK